MARPRKNQSPSLTGEMAKEVGTSPVGTGQAIAENPSQQLVELMTSFSGALQELKAQVNELREKLEQKVEVKMEIPPLQPAFQVPQPIQMVQPSQPVSTSTFLSQVPTDFVKVASEILGDKFKFECEASSDQPAFMFTVIVPQEYSPVKLPEIDRRPKVIQNVLGVNGVKDWCLLVKQNVLKHLGQNLITTRL